jgi:hypothetical protein
MRERMTTALKNATTEASRNTTDEEQIWESLRGFIVLGLIIEVTILFALSVLDLQYELLGMQIAYTAAIIGAPLFILGVTILTLGNRKFKSNN